MGERAVAFAFPTMGTRQLTKTDSFVPGTRGGGEGVGRPNPGGGAQRPREVPTEGSLHRAGEGRNGDEGSQATREQGVWYSRNQRSGMAHSVPAVESTDLLCQRVVPHHYDLTM